jgi:hypothetical protein
MAANLLWKCLVCGLEFLSETGLRRHLLLAHRLLYHRNQAPSPVPDDQVMQRIEKCRMNQANSRQRRAVRAIRENCNRPTSTTVESPPVVEANTGDTAVGSLYELAEDWPDFVDLSPVDVQPSVPRPVKLFVKDVEVQVRPEAESKDVQYTSSVQHASCQSLSTPVVGPELPPGGLSISDIISTVRQHPDRTPGQITQLLVDQCQWPLFRMELNQLQLLVATAACAEKTFATSLIDTINRPARSDMEQRRNFTKACSLAEEADNRFVSSSDVNRHANLNTFVE